MIGSRSNPGRLTLTPVLKQWPLLVTFTVELAANIIQRRSSTLRQDKVDRLETQNVEASGRQRRNTFVTGQRLKFLMEPRLTV